MPKEIRNGSTGPRAHSRRDFLQYSLGTMAAAGAAAVLPGCASSTGSSTTSVSAGKPRRGGTLHVGMSGGGSGDTLNAGYSAENLDFARATQLYDVLLEQDLNDVLIPSLAEEITPNKDLTVWTIRLRKGVTFHNGKSLEAEDVRFTLQRIAANHLFGAAGLVLVDVKNIKILDPLTLQLPCTAPYSTLPWAFFNYGFAGIIPSVGYDPKKPVGTGPFMFKSFTPGQESVFVKYPNYWADGDDGKPLPYVDEVVITNYTDETSLTNALISGAVDCIAPLTYVSIGPLKSAGQSSVVSNAGFWVPFTMRTDVAPFNEVDVRQAFRLIVDRPQMLKVVFGGYGLLGNDIFSMQDPAYDHAISQRAQDIDKAKFLLKKHGLQPMTTTLVTGPIFDGSVEAATVFAEQAAAANVKVNLQQTPVTEYYGANYLKWVFAQDWWGPNPYLVTASQATLKTAPINECHFDNPRYNQLYNEALALPEGGAKQTEIIHEMCMIDYTEGGYIIPFYAPLVDGFSPKLVGPVSNKIGSLSAQYFKSFWFKS
jgi:peptide/nickel transport system substrate-binding protein